MSETVVGDRGQGNQGQEEGERPAELERARLMLRALEPPAGAKERIEQTLLLQGRKERARTGWRWGLGLAFVAATSAAAVSDYIPVRKVLNLIQGTPANLEQSTAAASHHGSNRAATTPAPAASVEAAPAAPDLQAQPPSSLLAETPPSPAKAASHRTLARTEARESSAETPAPLPPSELAQLVAEFQAAKTLAKGNPEQGLAAFRRLQQRWPGSPLRPEIDLQIVSLLSRLGKREESKHQAEAFMHDHPENPRSKELARELQGAAGTQAEK